MNRTGGMNRSMTSQFPTSMIVALIKSVQ